MKRGMLSGYKTYVLALVAIIGAVAGWLTGDLMLQEAINTAWAGGVAATLRHAVASVDS